MTNFTMKSPIDLDALDADVVYSFARKLVAMLTEARSQLIAQGSMLSDTIVDTDSAYWLKLNDQHLQSWDFPFADATFEQAIKRAALDSGFLALAGYAELVIESRERRNTAASDLLERCDAELQRQEAQRESERLQKRLARRATRVAKQEP